MADFNPNFGGMNNPGQGMPNQGMPPQQNRPVPPPPPPPEITLRTMQSDLESVKQTGGESPVPKPFTPPEVKSQPMAAPEEEGMIKPTGSEGIVPPVEPKKSSSRAVILITVLVVVIAVVAFIGYMYIYPMFAKPAISVPVVTPPVTEQTPPVVETTPIPEELPPVEVATTTEEEIATEIATTTPEIVPPPAPVLKTHASYLVSPVDATVQLNLSASTTNLSSISSILSTESLNKLSTETGVKEVLLSNELGQMVFADWLPILLPDVSSSAELSALFEEDFTTAITYDKNGAWLGMVAKLKAGADPVAAKALIANLEKSASLKNLYFQDPGTPAAAFKAGSANNLQTRYLSYSKTGASLNYGWTADNKLVISASYNGMKAILTKLGIQ